MERDPVQLGSYLGLAAVLAAIVAALVLDVCVGGYLDAAWADGTPSPAREVAADDPTLAQASPSLP